MRISPIIPKYNYSISKQPNFNGDKKSNYDKNENESISSGPSQKTIDYIKAFARNAKPLANNEVSIKEYDFQTGNLKRKTVYKNGSTNIHHIDDFDPKTGNLIKHTLYYKDGKTILSETKYDRITGNRIKDISYNVLLGGFDFIEEFNSENGQRTKLTWYYEDGKTIKFIDNYNPVTGDFINGTNYRKDGTLSSSSVEYPDEKMSITTYYDNEGKTITYLESYDEVTHTHQFFSPDDKPLDIK